MLKQKINKIFTGDWHDIFVAHDQSYLSRQRRFQWQYRYTVICLTEYQLWQDTDTQNISGLSETSQLYYFLKRNITVHIQITFLHVWIIKFNFTYLRYEYILSTRKIQKGPHVCEKIYRGGRK